MNKVHNHDYDQSCKEYSREESTEDEVGSCLMGYGNAKSGLEDAVNPDHYSGDLVMRVIEERGLDFALGNAVKYLCRAGSKARGESKAGLAKSPVVFEPRN